jgi:hypothetical protein
MLIPASDADPSLGAHLAHVLQLSLVEFEVGSWETQRKQRSEGGEHEFVSSTWTIVLGLCVICSSIALRDAMDAPSKRF